MSDTRQYLAPGIFAEFHGFDRTFRTTIRGVTKSNPDGSERQLAVKGLRKNQELKLVREPKNPFDKWAVAVYNLSGTQLGYIPAGDLRLANHIDMGGDVKVRLVKRTGGPGFIGLFLKSLRRPYGAIIEIRPGDLDWKLGGPILHKSNEIEALIRRAHDSEADDPRRAISTYRVAIDEIVAMDSKGTVAAAWRRVRYPINRLSLLLDRCGFAREAYQEILRYERFDDVFGLLTADGKSVAARKERLQKKLKLSAL